MWTIISKTTIRFLAALAVVIVGSGLVISLFWQTFYNDSYRTRKNELEHIVALARNVLEPIVYERRMGTSSLGDARLRATEVLNHFTYTDGWGTNYVFLATYEGYALVEPLKPDAVGTYQMQLEDSSGTYITRRLLQAAKNGGGFVFYNEARIPGGPEQKKLSYVIGIPEIECYIGTGMYVDDVEEYIDVVFLKLLLFSGCILVFVLGMQYYFLYPLLQCLSSVSGAFREFDHLHAAVPQAASRLPARLADTEQLVENVQTMIAMAKQDRQALKERVAEVHRLAYFDPLTELPNRAFLEEWLKNELMEAATGQTFGAVMFLDLNDFKRVNDLFGHSSGDALLRQTGMRIQQVLPAEGRVFRLGGDEFVVVLPEFDRNKAETLARTILQAIACPYVFQEDTFYVTGSLGIALYPEDGTEMDSLLSKVDTAMYHAKEVRAGGYSLFNSSMHTAILQRLKLENSLAKALDRGQLELYYQPQIDLALNKPAAIEALLRWNLPGKGTVSPLDFIPIAEESGLIIPIGRWVLEEACRFCVHLHSLGYSDMYVTVNLSTKQVEQAAFIATVEEVLAATGLPPEFLELEITESLFMNSLNLCKDKLLELRQMGIRVALDDFGTGYSSLTRLRVLPFDVLKIDKEFIREISGEQSEIIRTIIKLAHILGMKVVVEGVETADQAEFVFDAAGDRIQGYYFSPPLSSTKLLVYLANVSGVAK